MTVLVYMDGKIASDSRACVDDLIISDRITKVAKGPGCIGGGSGDADELRPFLEWVSDGADVKKFTPSKDFWGFVAYKRLRGVPRLIRVENTGWFDVPLEKGEFMAGGSGREVAFGALEAGASVEEAVEAAINRITSCGGKVQVVSL